MKSNEETGAMVFKSNRLIEARYSLTLLEQKILLYAASKINHRLDNRFVTIELQIVDFFKMTGSVDSKNHEYINQTARGLMGKQLEIKLDNGGWELIQWVTRSKYEPQEGTILFEFHPMMAQYLLNLEKHYRGYPLQQVMQLESKYSIRIYELLIQWANTNHRSLKIEVEELRKKVGLTKDEYKRFTNFETYVIKQAVTELNNKSNIFITYEKIKKGRYINEIRFRFDIKANDNSDSIKEFKKLMDAGLVKHIEEIRSVFKDDELVFSDFQLNEAYNIAYNELSGIKSIEDNLQESIYRYMLYYYEYTKEKANRGAYKYYTKTLKEDYDRLKIILKYSGNLETTIYGAEI